MTRGLAVGLILLIVGSAHAAEDELLAHLHNASAGGKCERAAALVDEIEQVGDPRALLVLGGRLEEGRRCLPADPAHAARLYRSAAEQGEPLAMARLGRLYAQERGVPEDTGQARRWFRGAVLGLVPLAPEERRHAMRLALDGTVSHTQPYGSARPRCARNYPHSLAVHPRLLDQQLAWLNLIEASGPESQFDLALRLHAGDGIAKNKLAAEQLMLRLSSEQYAPAVYRRSLWQLAEARNGSEKWEAFRGMLHAASLGHLPAMLDLAHRMLHGRDIERDDFGAYVAFLLAAKRGADVAKELTLLDGRMDILQVRSARRSAARSSTFPPFSLKE